MDLNICSLTPSSRADTTLASLPNGIVWSSMRPPLGNLSCIALGSFKSIAERTPLLPKDRSWSHNSVPHTPPPPSFDSLFQVVSTCKSNLLASSTFSTLSWQQWLVRGLVKKGVGNVPDPKKKRRVLIEESHFPVHSLQFLLLLLFT